MGPRQDTTQAKHDAIVSVLILVSPTSVMGSATTAAMVSATSSVRSESVVQQLERVITCCEEEARARAAPHSHLLW